MCSASRFCLASRRSLWSEPRSARRVRYYRKHQQAGQYPAVAGFDSASGRAAMRSSSPKGPLITRLRNRLSTGCPAAWCQNRTTAAFYRSRMMLCVVRRCPSMSILDPPIDLQHGLIIHPGSPPSASPAMAHSISRALLDSRLARRRRFDAMSLTRPRR